MLRRLVLIGAVALAGCNPFASDTVDAFYYPDRGDLTRHEEMRGLTSVEACRDAVRLMAAKYGDESLTRGDYECGINPTGDTFGGITVYERTEK